jgi:hypothetical protein
MECRAPYSVLRDMLRYCIVINKQKSIHRTIRRCHCLMTTSVARAPFYCTDLQMIQMIYGRWVYLAIPDVRRQGTSTGTVKLDVSAYIRTLAEII